MWWESAGRLVGERGVALARALRRKLTSWNSPSSFVHGGKAVSKSKGTQSEGAVGADSGGNAPALYAAHKALTTSTLGGVARTSRAVHFELPDKGTNGSFGTLPHTMTNVFGSTSLCAISGGPMY